MQLTPHFSFEELTITTNNDYIKRNRDAAMLIPDKMYKLALFAEQVRAFLNVPMTITSAFRYADLNEAVGGSATSQHTSAQAIDFVPKNMTVLQAYEMLRKSPLVYGQLIVEQSGKKQWVHVGMGYKRENLRYVNGKYTKQGD